MAFAIVDKLNELDLKAEELLAAINAAYAELSSRTANWSWVSGSSILEILSNLPN